jgi:uncharacterized HAD superfamily protein/hypoxanthine phosphoribosyltransferase
MNSIWRIPSGLVLPRVDVNFRTLADLNALICKKIEVISQENFDLIVGIPRSGLLAGSIIALHLNLPLISLSDLPSLRDFKFRVSRRSATSVAPKGRRHKVLVVDDSTNTGDAIERSHKVIGESEISRDIDFKFLAAYGVPDSIKRVDFLLEIVALPRVFEWNFMHHMLAEQFLFDLDGVFCRNGPPEYSNDGGDYVRYIANAPKNILPTSKVGVIVTSRLSKYRSITEGWLARNGVQYRELIMLDLDTPEERRKLALHAQYKADVFNQLGGLLFVESENWQATEIFKMTGRPVFCTDTRTLFSRP